MSGRQRFSQQRVVRALKDCRGLVSLAARQLQCDRGTVENYIDRYPAVKAALHEAREQRLDVAEAMLFSAVDRGELPAITFYLRTVGRHRGYGEHVQLDATIDLARTPEWLETRALLLDALRAYPEARMAVVTRLRALAAPPEGPGDDAGAEDAG